MMYDRYGHSDHMNGGAWVMVLLMLLVVGLLVAVLVLLLVRSNRLDHGSVAAVPAPISGPTAVQILDERLARGAIIGCLVAGELAARPSRVCNALIATL